MNTLLSLMLQLWFDVSTHTCATLSETKLIEFLLRIKQSSITLISSMIMKTIQINNLFETEGQQI